MYCVGRMGRRRRKSGPLWQLSGDRCRGYALWYALESIEGLLGRMKNFSIFCAVCSPSLGSCARQQVAMGLGDLLLFRCATWARFPARVAGTATLSLHSHHKLSLGRPPQEDGQVSDSNEAYVSEKAQTADHFRRWLISLCELDRHGFRPCCFRVFLSASAGRPIVLDHHSGVTQGTTCRLWRR